MSQRGPLAYEHDRAQKISLGRFANKLDFVRHGYAPCWRPVKNLDEANGQIHWPEEMTPKKADSFVHNEIFIKAPANVIWSNLVKAKYWPKWYSGVGEQQKTGLRLAYRAGHIAGAVVRTVAARRRANSPCTRTPAC